MTHPANSTETEPRTIRFATDLWADAQEAARILNEREHGDLTAADIVRRALRKEIAAIKNQNTPAA